MKKSIFVTGCTKGIGLAIVELFAAKGFNVAGCARKAVELKKLQKKLQKKYPKQKFYLDTCDVTNTQEVFYFGVDVLNHMKKVDVLVNNAGAFIPGSITTEADGVFEEMMALNVGSAYHFSRRFAQEMIEKKGGHIFNLCSIASITAYANGGSYCISKFAMLGLSKVLREELKPHNVKVTAVLPGAVRTGSWNGTDLPDSRFVKPADVAKIIWSAYDLSDGATVEEIIIRPQEGDI